MLAIDCLAVPYSSAEIVIPLGIAVALGLCAFYLWFFIEALSWPRSTWEAAGVSRARWVARLFFLGAIGAVDRRAHV